MSSPRLQERFFIYVLGPNQDPRLASVAPGALLKQVTLQLDADAPFVMRGRAVRQTYTADLTQYNLQGLKSRWAGPTQDYRQQALISQTVEMAYFGQGANPKPIFPPVSYPANGIITVDVENVGPAAIPGLTFYFYGVKLFPWRSVPAYTYPDRFGGLPFVYPQSISQLGVTEQRDDCILTIRPDADFVMRAAQCTPPFQANGNTFGEVFIRFKDWNKKPYSNDFVHIDAFFGGGNHPATIPVSVSGLTAAFIPPFGTGPVAPGLMYPEIYLPKNFQMLYDLKRADSGFMGASAADFVITWIGGKVFPK